MKKLIAILLVLSSLVIGFGAQAATAKKPVVVPKVDQGPVLIKQYYSYLVAAKSDLAFAMLATPTLGLADYQAQYDDTTFSTPTEITKTVTDTYQYFLVLGELGKNGPTKNTYHLTTQVIKNQLNILSSDLVTGRATFNSKLSALAIQKTNESDLIINNAGKEIVVAKKSYDTTTPDQAVTYTDLSFSPTGKYLVYKEHQALVMQGVLYEVKTGKIKLQPFAMKVGAFSAKESYFFTCSDNSFLGSYYGTVYSTAKFDKKFEVTDKPENKQYNIIECLYSSRYNIVTFNLGFYQQSTRMIKKIVTYSLATGKATSKDVK